MKKNELRQAQKLVKKQQRGKDRVFPIFCLLATDGVNTSSPVHEFCSTLALNCGCLMAVDTLCMVLEFYGTEHFTSFGLLGFGNNWTDAVNTSSLVHEFL